MGDLANATPRCRCAHLFLTFAVAAGVNLACAPETALAATGDDKSTDKSTAPAASAPSENSVAKFFDEWFARSDRAKESQPHWMTPVVTVTPRLEQEYRYDQLWQNRPNGVYLQDWGFNKGLELIPTEHSEVIISVPGYLKETTPKGTEYGWADETLLLKLRLLSENEENGNYIVTGFLGVAMPTGNTGLPFTTTQTVWTPTVAAGKGWGTREQGFDIQSTLSVSYGDSNQKEIGEPIVWNTAFQAHIFDKLWPEVEVNYTHYEQGKNAGKSQTVITSGLILGRYELIGRSKFVIGVGYQQTVSTFRIFNNSWIVTARAPF
ncbi:MAG TPA: hypothetical protein VMH32_01795 [Burkholderiales bacterium]|nr:hypothetical protein [Burkholderiales bacterium]